MRASTYHRTAEYYPRPDPEVLAESGLRSRACFEAAAGLFDPPVEPLSIPFEDGVPAGLSRPARTGTAPGADPGAPSSLSGASTPAPRKTVLPTGRFPGAARGWQVVLFDGPGQTGCMRKNPTMTYRPDYEAPVGAVLAMSTGASARRADSWPWPE